MSFLKCGCNLEKTNVEIVSVLFNTVYRVQGVSSISKKLFSYLKKLERPV
jgi:hypothetical protein